LEELEVAEGGSLVENFLGEGDLERRVSGEGREEQGRRRRGSGEGKQRRRRRVGKKQSGYKDRTVYRPYIRKGCTTSDKSEKEQDRTVHLKKTTSRHTLPSARRSFFFLAPVHPQIEILLKMKNRCYT
jgi:hypothetical protein